MAPPRNRRPGFSRRAQYTLFIGYVIAVAGSLVGAVLLALATLDPPAFGALRATVAEVTTPISTSIAGAGRGIAAIPQGISDYVAVHDENQRLRKELDDAKALLMRARAISPCRVLDAGSWQGVKKGQPVRGPEGLIGQILETGPNSALGRRQLDADRPFGCARHEVGDACLGRRGEDQRGGARAAGRGRGHFSVPSSPPACGRGPRGGRPVTTSDALMEGG
eukprot:gene9677-13056_t